MRSPRRPPPPLDSAALERLALRYVERYATTQAKLDGYLRRKIAERGWAGERDADPQAIVARFAELGYVDDRAFAEQRAAALSRRGLGERRVDLALRQVGIAEEDRSAVNEEVRARAVEAALTFARRKRLGPFASEAVDRPLRERQLGAMLRAGHALPLARAILAMAPGDDPESLFGAG